MPSAGTEQTSGMDAAEHAAVRAREIERRLGAGSDVRWSPRDSTHIALNVGFPQLTRANALVLARSDRRLEDKIRAALSAEASRTVEV